MLFEGNNSGSVLGCFTLISELVSSLLLARLSLSPHLQRDEFNFSLSGVIVRDGRYPSVSLGFAKALEVIGFPEPPTRLV